jgi:hypothetical protein
MRSPFRLLRDTALAACVAALAVVVMAVPRPVHAAPADNPFNPTGTTKATPPGASTFGPDTFAQGQPRAVDMNPDGTAWQRMSEREKKDQMRDWVLVAAAGSLGLSADDLTRALADVPVARHDHLRAAAQPEYGVTRTCDIGSGKAVAVIPAGDDDDTRDHLGYVADEYRKNRGVPPEAVLVFEYQLDLKKIRATVTRKADVPGKELFTAAYGYHEQGVSTAADMTAFLGKVSTLTHAAKANKGVTLGGRKLLARKYRTLRTEDVAAIWQAQNGLPRFRDSVGFSLDPVYDFDALGKWFGKAVKPGLEEMVKEKKAGVTAEDIRDAELAIAIKAPHVVEKLLGKVRDAADAGVKAAEGQVKAAQAKAKAAKTDEEKDRAADEEDRAFTALDAAEGAAVQADGWGKGLGGSQFQQARYDGDLQGTEVGMVLFYTDLLAKMWAGLDVGRSAPVNDIAGFRTFPNGNPLHFMAKDQANPSIRLWFGPDPSAYQLLSGKSGVLFARRSTRLYAASSDPLKPGAEVPANPSSEAVLGWWNDHYEEVARYEPEYERLNEFTKWSLVVAWLAHERLMPELAALGGVKVDRSAWFPKWAKANTDLRFAQWEKVGFHPKGYKGTKHEAMPLLQSRWFLDYGGLVDNRMSGGVSGASPSRDIAPRPTLPATPARPDPTPVGRAWVPGKTQTYRGVDLTFDKGAVQFKAKPYTEYIGRSGEYRPQAVRGATATRPDGLDRTLDFGGRPQDRLEVTGTRGMVVVNQRVEGTARETQLAQQVSDAWFGNSVPKSVLATTPEARASVVLPDRTVLVRMDGSADYLRIQPAVKPTGELPPGVSAQVSSPTGAQTFHLSKVTAAEVAKLMPTDGKVRVDLPSRPTDRPVLDASPAARFEEFDGVKPPAEFKVTLTADGEPAAIPATYVREGNRLEFKVTDLPAGYRTNPEKLCERLRYAEGESLRAAAERAKPGDKLAVKLEAVQPVSARAESIAQVSQSLASGRPTDAIRRLDAVPEADRTLTWRMQRARAELQLGRDDAAAAACGMKAGSEVTRTTVRPFADELAARATDPKTPLEEQTAILQQATQGQWEMSVGFEGGRAVLSAGVRMGTAAKPGEVTAKDHVYQESGTGLTGDQINTAIKDQKLGQVLAGKDVELLEIYGRQAPRLGPERVSHTDWESGRSSRGTKTTEGMNKEALGKMIAAGLMSAAGLAAAGDGGDDDDDDDRRPFRINPVAGDEGEDEDDCDPDPLFPRAKKGNGKAAKGDPCPKMYLIRPVAKGDPKKPGVKAPPPDKK